jgi:hypothetical protein
MVHSLAGHASRAPQRGLGCLALIRTRATYRPAAPPPMIGISSIAVPASVITALRRFSRFFRAFTSTIAFRLF